MNIINAEQAIPDNDTPCVFLVGPTPRDDHTPSWRPSACDLLRKAGFDGDVLVPERKSWQVDYLDQVEWEHAGLMKSVLVGCILAWVPRELEKMPAFTTNVEFGYFLPSGVLYYGRPEEAPKTRYLDWLYTKETGRNPVDNLSDLVDEVLKSMI